MQFPKAEVTAVKKLLVKKNRICSIAALEDLGEISSCGYVMVGKCDDPIIFMRDDYIYTEVIYSWLGDQEQ